MKAEIKSVVRDALIRAYPEAAGVEFDVDEPSTGIEADVCSNAAFPLSKQLKQPPARIAESLAAQISDPRISKLEVAKNGFLNIFLSDAFLRKSASRMASEGERYFQKPERADAPVLIEFVSANPTGPLHIGHGRGAALGDSLARIYRQCGYPVKTEYYVNDIGLQMQILANSVEARHRQLSDPSAPFPEDAYKGDYVKEIAARMRDQKLSNFSEFPRQFILDWIRKDLEDFGVKFDAWFSEASLHKSGELDRVLEELKGKGALREKDGALWFVPAGEKADAEKQEEWEKDRVIRRSDGRYTYFASDIAYHRQKFGRGFRKAIDIWGHDHHGYVPRVESSLAALGLPKDFLTILLYQLVSLKRGGKRVAMSTRSGEFVTLREILDEVGRDACRFFFAMRSPSSQLDFDVDLAKKQSNENPVYYVQYVHARICSIFREAEKRGIALDAAAGDGALEKEEKDLIKKLLAFSDVLDAALKISSPHVVATHLIDTATAFHRFYDKHRILDAEPGARSARIELLKAARAAVSMGLSLLGVSAPERM